MPRFWPPKSNGTVNNAKIVKRLEERVEEAITQPITLFVV